MSFDPLTAMLDIGKTVLNKILPDRMDEAEKIKAVNAFTVEMTNAVVTQDKNFRDFVLEYEGAAKDVPRGLVWIRSAIRPAFTIMIGIIDYVYFTSPSQFNQSQADLLYAINLIVLAFWFGERAVKNSGIVKLLGKNKG